MTVASASTHLSGGPVSAVHNSTDSAESDTQEKKSDSKSASKSKSSDSKSKSKSESKSESDVEASAGESLANAVNHLTNLSKNAGEFTRSFVPEIGLPKPPKGNGSEYKAPSKGLDDQEKKGLWVLGGIVGLGLLIGGPKKEKKNGGEGGHLGGLVEKVKGEKGVQGDEEWAKASGAGVVGHGARKD
jgi:cobalamin biosynthesis Mg chelatase CobN